jgi:hypothetical protein
MKRTRTLLLTFLSVSGMVLAQDQPPSGWRRAGDAPPAPPATAPNPANPAQPADTQDPSQPVDRSNDAYGQPPQQAPMQAPAQRPSYGLPAQLTLKSGTYVTVRINQGLSSDRNHIGDTFSANLMAPVIVDGIVVANRGQVAYGRVAEVQKQHSDKPSRLGLELTGLTLADGTQAPVTSQLVAQQGRGTPAGIQAGTIVGTTAVGAAIGGAAAWGTGAAIGAGAGAAAGIIGVVLTRNHATILYPETALTFQVTSPVTISTAHSPQAFRFVGPEDSGRPYSSYNDRPAPQLRPGPGPAPVPPSYYYGGYDPYYYPSYPAYYYPYAYWGPSIWVGGGWGWRGGGFYGGGFRRFR